MMRPLRIGQIEVASLAQHNMLTHSRSNASDSVQYGASSLIMAVVSGLMHLMS